MPKKVSPDERLVEIAKATLRVAERGGANAVTIRSVAAEMGRTPVVVTHYVPTRAKLLANAVQYAIDDYYSVTDEQMEAVPDEHRFRELAHVLTLAIDPGAYPGVDKLMLELMAKSVKGAGLEAFRANGRRERDDFRAAADAAGIDEPDFAAELMYLVTSGVVTAEMVDPELWTPERIKGVVERLVDVLSAPAPALQETAGL
jgi:AcrR family transcriptional regulator